MCVTLLLMFEVNDFSVKAASSYAMQKGLGFFFIDAEQYG